MSAVFINVRQQKRRLKPNATSIAVEGSQVQLRTRAQSRASRAAHRALVKNIGLFFCVAFVAYGFSILTGNTLAEHARRSQVKAAIQTKGARADMAQLRHRLDRLTTREAIEGWALQQGFEAPYKLPGEEAAL
ncbi:MAG: hypothetical protein KDC26_05685 [Armatimonadetes bacterium]|nr:hypothetical protein [Armatimonadota bacterium]